MVTGEEFCHFSLLQEGLILAHNGDAGVRGADALTARLARRAWPCTRGRHGKSWCWLLVSDGCRDVPGVEK